MALNITTWSPDTCKCEIEYEWDDAVSQDLRIHSAHKINKACPFHQFADKVQHYNAVHEENTRKNDVFSEVLEKIPSLYQILTSQEKNILQLMARIKGDEIAILDKVLRQGVKVDWSFDAQRNLIVELKGFDAQEKSQVVLLASQKFGDKVKIV